MSSDWGIKRLGDLVTLKTGKLDSNAAEQNGRYPFFTCAPTNLAINSFAFDTEAVILAGNNANGLFCTKYYKGKFNAYQRTYVIEPIKADETSCRYLYFVITDLVGRLKELSVGSATKFLTKTILEGLPLQLPPIGEQVRIAEILSALDDRIALLRETNATLEAIAQALFKSWFVDFDPVRAKQQGLAPEGMDEATAGLFPDGFEESEQGLLPEGWRAGTLVDVAQTVKTQLQPSELHAGMNYVGLEHIPRKSLSLTNWDTADGLESAKASFSEGDVLFGKLRPYFHKVVVAPFDGVCSTDILVCQARTPDYYGLAVMLLSAESLISYADRLSNGAKMPRVSWKDLSAYPIAVPPPAVAAAYNDVVTPLLQKLKANVVTAQTLSTLRDTLLPRLISGQLRLPEAGAILEECTP